MGLTSGTMLAFVSIFEMMPSPTVVVSYQPNENQLKPFCFVLNVSELAGTNALEIIPGCILRRANEEEVKFIKEQIELQRPGRVLCSS